MAGGYVFDLTCRFALYLTVLSALLAAAAVSADQPKLLVFITIDQLRVDMPWHRLLTPSLRR